MHVFCGCSGIPLRLLAVRNHLYAALSKDVNELVSYNKAVYLSVFVICLLCTYVRIFLTECSDVHSCGFYVCRIEYYIRGSVGGFILVGVDDAVVTFGLKQLTDILVAFLGSEQCLVVIKDYVFNWEILIQHVVEILWRHNGTKDFCFCENIVLCEIIKEIPVVSFPRAEVLVYLQRVLQCKECVYDTTAFLASHCFLGNALVAEMIAYIPTSEYVKVPVGTVILHLGLAVLVDDL